MPTIHIRLTGSEDDARTLMTAIHAMDGIDHVEEIDDLMPYADEYDSSSAGLSDVLGPGMHEIEVEAPHERAARHVRNIADLIGENLGIPIEVVDEF